VITLLDALQGINPIKMCTAYELKGEILESWPIQPEIIENCKPLYRTFEGWEELTRDKWSEIALEGYDALPNTMKVYIQAIKDELETDIAMISIGPDRTETIVLDENIF
jgi:adenylosuccinate synthase